MSTNLKLWDSPSHERSLRAMGEQREGAALRERVLRNAEPCLYKDIPLLSKFALCFTIINLSLLVRKHGTEVTRRRRHRPGA